MNTNIFYRFAALAIALIALAVSISAQNGPGSQNLTGEAGTFAITNARIVTVSGAVIEKGSIVIANGKISALGATVSIPSSATKIDGTGLSVYPGMIDAGTNMGLLEIGNGAAGTVDIAETGEINPNAQAILGINPHTSHINVTRVNGITTVLSMPAGSLVSGQSAVINLNGSTQAEMAVVSHFGLVIDFPQVSTFAGFDPVTGPRILEFSAAVKRRDERLEELKKVIEAARRYADVKEAYQKDKSLPAPMTDLKMEAMIPYVRGERPVIFNAQRDRDIKGALEFAKANKLKAIINGGAQASRVAKELKEADVPVIFNRIYGLPFSEDDAYDSLFEVPAKLAAAGVRFCVSTGDDGANVRDLPYQAGLAGAFGLSRDDALKSVTLYPAQILGIDSMVGSLEVGKVANIVVTDGDLLEPTTNIKHLFITGRKIPLVSRHTMFFDAFKDRKLPN
ncbi:MAG: amidohydrolase family protein [Pyrinomonadaceae bacterium]